MQPSTMIYKCTIPQSERTPVRVLIENFETEKKQNVEDETSRRWKKFLNGFEGD